MITLPQFYDKSVVTNSEVHTFRTCQRRHYNAYVLGVRPERQSAALRIGTNIHAGIEARSKGASVDDAILAATAGYRNHNQDPQAMQYEEVEVASLLAGYFWYWERDDLPLNIRIDKNVAAEQNFRIRLPGKNTTFGGKIDGIVTLGDGRTAVLETKTAGEDIGPASKYCAKLRIDNQISGYIHAARALRFDTSTVLYNIIRKPTIQPYSATPVEKRKYTKEGKLYASQRELDETPDEYGVRLRDSIQASPDWYFARYEIPRLDSELAEWIDEMKTTMTEMQVAGRRGSKSKNTSVCTAFGGCPYLSVCGPAISLGGDVPSGFRQITTHKHEELQ